LGKDTVVVNICDQQIPKQCKNDTIFITVEQNSPIIIKSEQNSVEECHSVGGNIIDVNDMIYQNKPVIVPEVNRNTKLGGKFSVDAQGVYSYTAPCNKGGVDTLIVNVCDTQTPKQCKNDTLFITVTLNKPVAENDINMPNTGKLDGNDSPTSGLKNSWYIVAGDTPKDDKGQTVGTVSIDPLTSVFEFKPTDPNFEGTVTFHYYIVDDNNQVSNVATVTINVLPIWIPEGFSPNGDGVHDKFVITNFDKDRFPKNTINILNRWGNKVYVAQPYNNEWDGTNNQGMSVGGNVLPVGTYFYILDLGTGLKPFRGYVYLSR
jgi:gliding motility-associated-like protein